MIPQPGFLGIVACALAGAFLWLRGCDARRLRIGEELVKRSLWKDGDAIFVIVALFLFLLSSGAEPATTAATAGDEALAVGAPKFRELLFAASIMPFVALIPIAARSAGADVRLRELLLLESADARRDIALGFGGGLALLLPSLILSWGMGSLLESWGAPTARQDSLRWFLSGNVSWSVRCLIAFQAVVIAPIVEEVLYRGVLLSAIMRGRGMVFSILAVSAFFAVSHMQARIVPPLLFVGAGLSLALLRTGSLLAPIVMHSTFNAANLCLAWLSILTSA